MLGGLAIATAWALLRLHRLAGLLAGAGLLLVLGIGRRNDTRARLALGCLAGLWLSPGLWRLDAGWQLRILGSGRRCEGKQ